MKAVLCESFGPPESLVVEDALSDQTERDPARRACCRGQFPDTLMIEGKYQFAAVSVFARRRAAGVVAAVGEKSVT